MQKKLLTPPIVVFIIILALYIAACTGTDEKKDSVSTKDTLTTLRNETAAAPAGMLAIHGTLDTLWIDSMSFAGLSSRVTFRFYVDANEGLTLHGWTGNPNQYPAAPDVMLKRGNPGAVTFGSDCYFGNLILTPNEVNTIKHLLSITRPAPYVLFAPQSPATNGKQITYTIFLSDTKPDMVAEALRPAVITATGTSTNPSPPARI